MKLFEEKLPLKEEEISITFATLTILTDPTKSCQNVSAGSSHNWSRNFSKLDVLR